MKSESKIKVSNSRRLDDLGDAPDYCPLEKRWLTQGPVKPVDPRAVSDRRGQRTKQNRPEPTFEIALAALVWPCRYRLQAGGEGTVYFTSRAAYKKSGTSVI